VKSSLPAVTKLAVSALATPAEIKIKSEHEKLEVTLAKLQQLASNPITCETNN